MNSAPLPPKFFAASEVLRSLAALASALLGLSALAVAVGWKARSSYYNEIGAEWIVRSEPLSSMIQAGSQSLLMSAIGLCLGFLLFANEKATSVGLRRSAITTLVIGGTLIIVPPLFLGSATPPTVLALAILGSIAVFFSVGLTVVEVMARFHEQNNTWHPYFLWLFYLSIIYGFLWVPSQTSIAQARNDVSIEYSRLAVVDIGDAIADSSVRLISINGDQAILVSLTNEPERATFRVMAAKDIRLVHSTRIPR